MCGILLFISCLFYGAHALFASIRAGFFLLPANIFLVPPVGGSLILRWGCYVLGRATADFSSFLFSSIVSVTIDGKAFELLCG